MAQVTRDALTAVEQDGIVFIDEIDKIVTGAEGRYGEQQTWLRHQCGGIRGLYTWKLHRRKMLRFSPRKLLDRRIAAFQP